MKVKEKKITLKQLKSAQVTSTGIRPHFHAYCAEISCCEECNRWVRLFCKLKCWIEKLQTVIIFRICKED